MRKLLLSLLLLGGCIASVHARPIGVDCWSQIAPIVYCETEYVWVPGYWVTDVWSGYRRWVPGHYQRRPGYYPRDHRR